MPVVAAVGRATGVLHSTVWGTVIGVAGMLIALGGVVGDPPWHGPRVAPDPARDDRSGPGALGRDRLVRHPAAGSDADVRDRLARAHDRAWIIVPILVAIALTT